MTGHWEFYKEKIRTLYLDEGKTLNKVIDEMRIQHEFDYSKQQYERQLKNWGFRKHRKATEWQDVGRKIQKRKRDGKDSEIYRNGENITKKACKEVSRNYFSTPQEQYGQALTPRTPPGFYICTPLSSLTVTSWLPNLPWIQFTRCLGPREKYTPDLASIAHTIFLSRTEIQTTQRIRDVSNQANGDLSSWITCLATYQGNSIRNIHSRLKAVFPDDLDIGISTAGKLVPMTDLDAMPYIKVIVYLLSNNLLEAAAGDKVIKMLRQQKDLRLLHHLLSTSGPAAEALAENLFIDAVHAEDDRILQVVLGRGTNPDKTTKRFIGSPLCYLVQRENIPLVKLLLDHKADVNAPPAEYSGRTALQAACEKGNLELVQILLDAGADINAPPTENDGRTALQAACEKGNLELVQILLDTGADVDAPPAEFYGRTALQAACEKGNLELVQMLLNAGADINAPPAKRDGRTALQAACEKENLELVQMLLDAGADVNVPPADIRGVTALQAASIYGYIGIVLQLLEHQADVNAPAAKEEGRTAIEGAAEHGRIDIVQLLLNAGVELRGQGHAQYKRAMNLASKQGHLAIRKLLEAVNPDSGD